MKCSPGPAPGSVSPPPGVLSCPDLHFLIGSRQCLSSSTMPAEDPRIAAERIKNVIESPIRTDQDRRMDAARHPAEFLPFTQVKPGMPWDLPAYDMYV